MRKPELYDTVRLKVDLPEWGLSAGEIGAIVLVFDTPQEAYEVEFTDEEGRTRVTCALTADQFEIVE